MRGGNPPTPRHDHLHFRGLNGRGVASILTPTPVRRAEIWKKKKEWNASECKTKISVDTFDHANPPILSWSICSPHNLVNFNILCQEAQLNVASALWRDWKLLYEAPWPTRDCKSALHKHKDIDWYRLRCNRVCPSEWYMSRPLLVN